VLNFDDAEDRENTLVGFGKHRNLTYKDAWDLHPRYCTGFVLHAYNQTEKPKIRALGEWLLEQGAEPMEGFEMFDDDSVVGFGPLENMTFREAWKKDALYCERIVRAYGEFYRQMPECKFARWLQIKGVDAEARPPRGDDILSFGKLEGLTFKEAKSEDIDYCRYIVRCADGEIEGTKSMSLERFAKWLKMRGVVSEEPSGPDCLVGFGKLKDQTYQEALTQEREYCDFVMERYEEGKKADEEGAESDTGPLLMKFGKWLEEQGVEARVNEYEARAQAAANSGEPKHERYEQILAERPEHSESILRLSDHGREDIGAKAEAFADWLRARSRGDREQEPASTK
jgi:hypothetical protein